MTNNREVVGHGEPREMTQAHPLVQQAIEDSLSRLNPRFRNRDAEARVIDGITYALAPYTEESEYIARERNSRLHQAYLGEVIAFNPNALEGAIACPDGRNDMGYILGGPGEIKIDRRIGAIPEIRKSTQEDEVVIDDPDLSSNIETAIAEKTITADKPELIEYVMPHIISTHPDHGCGYLKGETQEEGFAPGLGMTHGGIEEYIARVSSPLDSHHRLDLRWETAFANNARRAGAKGTTFLAIADHYSQGLILAPFDIAEKIDPNKSLRANLEALHESGDILMTEALDGAIHQRVLDLAASMGQVGNIDYRNYKNLIANTMLIGRVAMEITVDMEKNGFSFLPPSIIKDASATALKALAFRAIRNSTFRILSGLTKGNHPHMRHPERFVRAGSSGAEYNSQYVPFVQRTTEGRFEESDVKRVKKLYDLLTATLLERGTNLEQNGRVITITGEVNPQHFKNAQIAERYIRAEKAFIAHNASIFRDKYERSIASGQTIVIGVLFDSSTHTPKEIVCRR